MAVTLFLCSSCKWEPNPDHPFTAPQHLKEKIHDFEVNEAPSIGLLPRPLGNGETPSVGLLPTPTGPPIMGLLPTPGPLGGGNVETPTSEETAGPPVKVDEDMEFFVS